MNTVCLFTYRDKEYFEFRVNLQKIHNADYLKIFDRFSLSKSLSKQPNRPRLDNVLFSQLPHDSLHFRQLFVYIYTRNELDQR